MTSRFSKIVYSELSARKKENFNFQKVSAVLADYGYTTIRLSDDWNGADFLALHKDGETLKVQLKPRITLCTKYSGKGIWVAAPHGSGWHIYPHDEAVALIEAVAPYQHTRSWRQHKEYSWNHPSKALLRAMSSFYLKGDASAG